MAYSRVVLRRQLEKFVLRRLSPCYRFIRIARHTSMSRITSHTMALISSGRRNLKLHGMRFYWDTWHQMKYFLFPSQIPLKSALPILFQMFLILPFSNPGALLGRSNFGDLVFTGTLMIRSPAVGTTPDDDYVGLIFGFQSNMSVLKYVLLRRWKPFIQIQLKQRI